MAFTIPDESSAGHADQAEPKTLDFQALARRDTGVVSGCAVTAQSVPDMTVAVASGVVRVAGTNGSVTGANVTITANVSANPRYDAVVSASDGTLSAIAGTAAPETTLDQPGVNLGTYAVLAIIYVSPGATSIASGDIVQKQQAQNPNAFHTESHALNAAVHTGTLDDAQIPSGVARDAEVTTAVSNHTAATDPHGDRAAAATDAGTQVSTHAGAADPHTGYQKESERAVASGYASLDSNAQVPTAQLPLPTSTTLGAIKSKAAVTHQFLTSIGTDGLPVGAQPAAADITGLFDGSTTFALSGDITPTALSASQIDYNPTGLSTATVVRQATNDTTARGISGFVGGADGRFLVLYNLGPGLLVLINEDAAATAANRFTLQQSTNFALYPDASALLQYDGTTSRWHAVSRQVGDIIVTFSKQGAVVTTTDATAGRWYNDTGRTIRIQWVRATAVTAPTGSTLIVDVNVNGTTAFTTQANRPAIAISGNTAKATNPDVIDVTDGSYLTVNVDQIGSTVAGSDLTVQVGLKG